MFNPGKDWNQLTKDWSAFGFLAPIVMVYLKKGKRQSNTHAGGLEDLLGGGQSQSRGGGLLDKNRDGNVLDDILGMIK